VTRTYSVFGHGDGGEVLYLVQTAVIPNQDLHPDREHESMERESFGRCICQRHNPCLELVIARWLTSRDVMLFCQVFTLPSSGDIVA